MIYTHLIQLMFQKFDQLLAHYTQHGYIALAAYLKYPLGYALTLWIGLLGLSIMQGWIDWSFQDFVQSTLRLGCIYLFTLHWNFFSDLGLSSLNRAAEQIGHVIVQATALSHTGDRVADTLQTLFNRITQAGWFIWNKASFHNFSPILTSIVIWSSGYGVILIAMGELFYAKLMSSLLLVTAPLFMSFTLFEVTVCFFHRWLGALVGFSFCWIFILALLALLIKLLEWVMIDGYSSQALGHMVLIGFVPMLTVGFIGIRILTKTVNLSREIGQGIAGSPLSHTFAQRLRQMLKTSLRSPS